jgi:hypothetical protein
MMQPLSGTGAHPPGEPPVGRPQTAPQPLTPQQRTVLERLVTRIIALSQQPGAGVWAALKHDLGMNNDQPLLARHFPAAEQNLQQRLSQAQVRHEPRQVLQQLTVLLQHGNNRQAVSDYIRQQFGQTVLSQLTPDQLKQVLTLLQRGELSIPQPVQRPATERPLLPAEHNALNQLVGKLSAATGESAKLIWQSMLELTGAKHGAPIAARHYAPLTTWLQARLMLSRESAPTLHSLQAALKQPLEGNEWREIGDYARQQYGAQPNSILTPPQVQDLLNQLLMLRCDRVRKEASHSQEEHVRQEVLFGPIMAPLNQLKERPGLALIVVIAVIVLLWLML